MRAGRQVGFEPHHHGVDDDLFDLGTSNTLDLTSRDYALAWPRAAFVAEATALSRSPRGYLSGDVTPVELLLEEAFVGSTPLHVKSRKAATMRELLRRADELREEGAAPAYYMQRLGPAAPVDQGPDWSGAKRRIAALVIDFEERGYFDHAWGRDCVDAPRDYDRPADLIEDRLGIRADPLDAAEWLTHSDALFLSIVEVLHDLIARPRVVESVHLYAGCGRHFGQYITATGQAIYRHRVDEVLARTRLGLRFAASGEDVGRLVRSTDDPREELLGKLAVAPKEGTVDEVSHAIATFRNRGATRTHKRSAVTMLARVLEDQRALVKEHLLSKDEGALFQIANQFDIRHKNADQRSDYDDAYLDWLFWWYLATVDLMTHLSDRDIAP